MDEDEVNHLNNPPVVERAPSPELRNNRRRREPTEADYLNPRVWRRRAPDGAHYMTPPRDFHPSDNENEETFRRSRQRPACQPEYVPQSVRTAVPNSREAARPEVNAQPVNPGQTLPGEREEWVNVRVRADDPVLNRDRVDIPPVNRDHFPQRSWGMDEGESKPGLKTQSLIREGRARPPLCLLAL
jgi:hypothetical protein